MMTRFRSVEREPFLFFFRVSQKEMSVMESVAHGVKELPVIMRVPNYFYGDGTSCESYFMLGYGDIAVPGLAVAYCHSYDLIVKKGPWYCLLAIICYAAALVVAFIASHMTRMGQPALLYLVPGVILPIILLAWCRGDLRDFWRGNFVPKKGLLSSRLDLHASSSEQFQMIQGRRLLYVTTPVFSWLVFPLPVSQKAYNALRN
ncbi:signal peptide peptidase-like 2C [Haemaphysalis longicornis]